MVANAKARRMTRRDFPHLYQWLGLALLVAGGAMLCLLGGRVWAAGLLLAAAGAARVVQANECGDWRGAGLSLLLGAGHVLLGLLAWISGWSFWLALALLAEGAYAFMLPSAAPNIRGRRVVLAAAATGGLFGIVALFAGGWAVTLLALQMLLGGAMFLAMSSSPNNQEADD